MENIRQCNKGKKSMSMSVKKLVTLGLLAAISIVLVAIIHFPLFPVAAPFLEYDPADIPILIGALAFGPGAGLILTIIASTIQAFTVSAHSGVAGLLMHIVATGAMSVVVGTVYQKSKKTTASMILALGLGCVAMLIGMVGANLVITPLFMGVDVQIVKAMLVPVIIPFNAIKAIINGIFAFIVGKALDRFGLFDEQN